jgi:hypothetical protein
VTLTRFLAVARAFAHVFDVVLVLAVPLAFDAALWLLSPSALVALLAIGVVACAAAGWAMHVYPDRMISSVIGDRSGQCVLWSFSRRDGARMEGGR